ncbi:hypothetical protein CYMTET_52774 [Cymbomonas tetramitiformis]|uniref:Uncharacterized protein n=1 Tax=Cymbomonas tetramitiformis TaxID=36881 RepID=A0AAE0BJM2_9CHLO|nr:hypothetical protein CYMTET_52774 [Cymbomonas tetramitiformis]
MQPPTATTKINERTTCAASATLGNQDSSLSQNSVSVNVTLCTANGTTKWKLTAWKLARGADLPAEARGVPHAGQAAGWVQQPNAMVHSRGAVLAVDDVMARDRHRHSYSAVAASPVKFYVMHLESIFHLPDQVLAQFRKDAVLFNHFRDERSEEMVDVAPRLGNRKAAISKKFIVHTYQRTGLEV